MEFGIEKYAMFIMGSEKKKEFTEGNGQPNQEKKIRKLLKRESDTLGIVKKMKFDFTHKCYMHSPESVLEIFWDTYWSRPNEQT